MTTNNNLKFWIDGNSILGLFMYLAIGLAAYLWLSDVSFSWASPWVYIYMVLWPFILFFKFFWYIALFILGIFAFGVACIVVVDMVEKKVQGDDEKTS